MKLITTFLAASFLLSSNLSFALSKDECLALHYDAYVKDQLVLFKKAEEVYKQKFPELFPTYKPTLESAILNVKINQHVFHYLLTTDKSKLDLKKGLPESTPMGESKKCDQACNKAMFTELSSIEQFSSLFEEMLAKQAEKEALSSSPDRRKAIRSYHRVLKDDAVKDLYLKAKNHFKTDPNTLKCKQ